MKARPRTALQPRISALFAVLAFLAASPQCSRAADPPGKSEPAAAVSTANDRTALSLTVYNSNLVLVREVRRIHLRNGTFVLRYADVLQSINAASVQIRSLDAAGKLSIVEQDYAYDQLDPQKLLQKYVGRDVTLVQRERQNGSTKWVQTKATLLADSNGPVWKIGDQIVTGAVADSYRFPELPAGLYSKPTLLWTLDNRGANDQRIEVSYLAGNMSWSADYALTISGDETSAGLEGWVTLANNSGTAFENAKLQLVAGQVHQVTAAPGVMPEIAAKLEAASAGPFQQQSFSEYHLYTLSRRASIQNDESKQISLLSAAHVAVEKYFEADGQPYYYRNPQGIGNATREAVNVYYRFENDERAGLGMPLPGGTMRVYRNDAKGAEEFIGEDAIGPTSKGETARVNVGEAFDIVCERKELDYKRLANNSAEMEYQIAVRNHKDSAVTVEAREPVGGTWEVENANYNWTKIDARTIGFKIPVEKDGSATLEYRVRVKW